MTTPPTYEDVVEGLTSGLVAVNNAMEITVFNLSAERLTEISRAQALRKKLGDIFKVDSWITELVSATINEGILYNDFEESLQRRFSGPLKVSVNTHKLYDSKGEPCGATLLIKDITTTKAIETEELRKDRLAYIGTFTASLAHEVKNPLSGIRGSAQLIERRTNEPALKEFADVIVKEADRLNAIVVEMLDFTRTGKLNKEPVNIHMLLDKVLLLLGKDGQPRESIKDLDPSLPPVLADEDKLTQVFLNLLKNAFEAASESKESEVRITTRIVTGKHITSKTKNAEKVAAVEISDNGPGIPPEVMEEIFTPFFTTKAEGSGLGMGISHKIIEEHGGLLEINSEVGVGTKVTIHLPATIDKGRS